MDMGGPWSVLDIEQENSSVDENKHIQISDHGC